MFRAHDGAGEVIRADCRAVARTVRHDKEGAECVNDFSSCRPVSSHRDHVRGRSGWRIRGGRTERGERGKPLFRPFVIASFVRGECTREDARTHYLDIRFGRIRRCTGKGFGRSGAGRGRKWRSEYVNGCDRSDRTWPFGLITLVCVRVTLIKTTSQRLGKAAKINACPMDVSSAPAGTLTFQAAKNCPTKEMSLTKARRCVLLPMSLFVIPLGDKAPAGSW